MKNKDIIILYETICKMIEDKEIKLDVKNSYKLIKNKHELENFYDMAIELRKEIVGRYTYYDEDGEVKVPKDAIDNINKQIRECEDIENDVFLDKFKLEELISADIGIEYLDGLYCLIEE